jgi:NADPH:quinone reductase
MKAIRMHAVGGPDGLQLDEVDIPSPGTGQVLIKVEAAGIAYGDIMKRQGAFGHDLPLPCGLGLEIAGTVAALGADTNGPAVGTRVMARVDAGYAEYAVAPVTGTARLPDNVDLVSAASLPVKGLTAFQALRDAGALQAGQSVLIHAAAGGVGSIAVQLAHTLGADCVIGAAGSPSKLDHIRNLGATAAVNYSDDDWPQRVLEATNGRGVDLVLDSVGGDVANRSVDCLAPFGRMVSYGAAGGVPADVSSMSLMHKNLGVVGYSIGGWLDRVDHVSAEERQLLQHVASGQITVSVGQNLPLEKAEEAHRAIGERATVGATVLTP